MAKRQLNISQNNENMLGDLRETLTPQTLKKEKAKPVKRRTSLVMNVDEYEYIKECRRVWSFERKQDLTIEDVISEIIQHHKRTIK